MQSAGVWDECPGWSACSRWVYGMSVQDGPPAVGGVWDECPGWSACSRWVYGMSVQDGPHAVGGCMG